MNKKKNVIVVLGLIIILLNNIGCSSTDELAIPVQSNEPKPPMSVINDVKHPPSMPPIIVNDSLLDLSVEDFKREYARLPDGYKIEIGLWDVDFENTFIVDQDVFSIKMDKESGTITKRQAEQVNCVSVDPDAPFDMSLKGLRYFPNIKSIHLEGVKLNRINELGYLSNLEEVCFNSCDLGIGKSTDKLKGLAKMKKIDIEISNCELKNIDFLKYFSNLNSNAIIYLPNNLIKDISPLYNLKKVYDLDLSGNKIKDIRPLSNLKKVSRRLYLEHNQIKDISPLSNLMEVSELDLSNNKIFDLKPLANLKKIDELWLENNAICDINILTQFTELKELNVKGNPIKKSQLKDFILKKKKGETSFKY